MIEQLILNGWKDICKAWGIKSVKTMKKKVKKYKIPLVWMDGKPTISRPLLLSYHGKLSDIKNPEKKV